MNLSSLSIAPPSYLPRNWDHHVFPSFHGADVRKNVLSHILKEFENKGIDSFNDNKIKRGEFIGSELIKAIKGSRIAIALLSKRYASSSWCLDELVEIMKCKEELGQTVVVIFYEVDPTDVRKQSGEFGEAFGNTCRDKTKENIEKWREALAKVAKIAGYHSSNWKTEAEMVDNIATDISNMLNNSTPSCDFIDLVGMREHMKKMKPLLCLESKEVKMIGIWGPAGIGKSTIARSLFSNHSHQFQLSVFMKNMKIRYPLGCSDYFGKLKLQKKFLSKILKHKVTETTDLKEVVQQRLNDKKVLVILDEVDSLGQLEALANKPHWFGPGSRVVITTEDRKLLQAHDVNHVYKVKFPCSSEAFQIFCMNAFGQDSPKDGFEELAWEVAHLTGRLPLGLKVMGSYFRGMSKQQWKNAIPTLKTNLDGEIESILTLSYDALCDDDKYLFLHIACFFNRERIDKLEELLANTFPSVSHGLQVLADKSLISMAGQVEMHQLLAKLGNEIVRKGYAREPGKRQFLDNETEIFEVLNDPTADSSSLIGIKLLLYEAKEDIMCTNKRAFEKMTNLQFLRIYGDSSNRLFFPRGLNTISQKLRLLEWEHFPMTCFPSKFKPELLVQVCMKKSKLKKLWQGIQPLKNLKLLELSHSINLKEIPDLSTATNLKKLFLIGCSSLVNLPSLGNATSLETINLSKCSRLKALHSSVGNATNLTFLDLSGCSSLAKLPSSIGKATKLTEFNLSKCSSLVSLPSIGDLYQLSRLRMDGCSKLEVLPININMESLHELDLSDCSRLKRFPEISTNIRCLNLIGSAIEEVPPSIMSWPCLEQFRMSYSVNLNVFPYALHNVTELHLSDAGKQDLSPWIKEFSCLRRLVINGMKKLIYLPQLPDSLWFLDAENCVSLERLHEWPFPNINIRLNFLNCIKLDKEAASLIILTSTLPSIFPCIEVRDDFFDDYKVSGDTITVKLNARPLHTSLRFKVGIVLVNKFDRWVLFECMHVSYRIMDKQNELTAPHRAYTPCLPPAVPRHLYTFELEADMSDVTSNEFLFEIKVNDHNWDIKECGLIPLF